MICEGVLLHFVAVGRHSQLPQCPQLKLLKIVSPDECTMSDIPLIDFEFDSH